VDQGGVPERPITIAIPGFVSMSMAFWGSYVLKSNGKVYPMGGANGLKVLPTPVAGLPDITQIDGASGTEYALAANGHVYAWTIRTGDTTIDHDSAAEGQQGNGSATPSFTPVRVSGISTATAIAANVNTGYALLADGTVMAWGGNDVGELGDGQSGTAQQFVTTPQPVTGVSGATALSGGWQGAFALTGTAIREWGCDAAKSYVSWDAGGPYITDTPVRLSGLPAVSAVSAGQGAGFALTRAGTVWSWGDNSGDATGQGDNAFSWHEPARIRTLPAIRSLTATSDGGAAVSTPGRVYVWGSRHAPHPLAGVGTVSQIGSGASGQLWALLS
jgi:alpha-tubulin suppressor-like RCC1 family protein